MSMTFWVHVLKDRRVVGNDSDHSQMYATVKTLDGLCAELGVQKLSDFVDHTDLEHNMAEVDDDDEEPVLDPETGWPYGIDDMNWFDSAKGLAALRALEQHLQATADLPRAVAKAKMDLLEEIRDCIEQLESAAANGQPFHLAVVM